MQFTRESIIVSSVRSFCTSFAAVIGILIGLVLVFGGLMLFSAPQLFPPKSELTIAPDANGKIELLAQTAPVILKLDITGVVGHGDLTTEKMKNLLSDSRQGLLSADRVKAVLLYINTPGGTVDDADAIYRSLLEYKKRYQVPIYAYVDGLCASGGMYIASSADRIFASPTSVIGSVGVILGPAFNFYGLMERYGVQSKTLTEGKDKDMLNPFRPWQPGEDTSLRQITAALYQRFVDIVVSARPQLNRERLINDYGAQVFISQKAQDLGYIDVANSDYQTTLVELAKAAHIPEDTAYQVMTIAPSHPFLSDLTEGKLSLLSGKMVHSVQLDSFMNTDLSGRFLYLYHPNYVQ